MNYLNECLFPEYYFSLSKNEWLLFVKLTRKQPMNVQRIKQVKLSIPKAHKIFFSFIYTSSV